MNTSTYAPTEDLERLYAPAVGHPDVVGVAVSTRPDCVGPDVVEVLKRIRAKKHVWVELGLQSSNDSTLGAINRGHTAAEFKEAARRVMAAGIDVCAHLIIGLPGEGRPEVLETMDFVRSLGLWGVKFHQMQVIRGTRLEEMYKSGRAGVLGLEEYANLVVDCLERLGPGVVVHRLSGEAPERFIVAPRWGANKFMIIEKILGLMDERGSFQGSFQG